MTSRYTHHCAVCDRELDPADAETPTCPAHEFGAIYLRTSDRPTRFEERVTAVEAAGGLDVTVLASSAPPCDSKASVAYVQREDSRILCVWNHTHLTWGLPGGKAEPGEDFADAMVRELKEETGLIAKSYAPVFSAPSSSGSGRMVTAFVVDVWRADGWQDFDDARQIEVDSPIAWLRREDLLRWSKFESYYRPMFAAIDARTTEPHHVAPETGSAQNADRGPSASSAGASLTATANGATSCDSRLPPWHEELAAIRVRDAETSDAVISLRQSAFADRRALLRIYVELSEHFDDIAEEFRAEHNKRLQFENDNAELRRKLTAAQERINALEAAKPSLPEEDPSVHDVEPGELFAPWET